MSLAIAMTLAVPTIVGAQEKPSPDAAAPQTDAPAAVMSCPMMGHAPMHVGMMGGGPMSGGMMGRGPMHMGGMRAMAPGWDHPGMGPGMGRPGMMGMMPMPGPDVDPKERGRWMRMRGDMMKAMGEILTRYGRELEAGK